MSTFADNARDWWERKNPRERVLVLALTIVAPITIAVYLGSQITDGLNKIEASNNETRRALAALVTLRASGPLQPVDSVLAEMPAEPIGLESYLSRAAEKVKLKIQRFTPRNPVTKNGFITHAMQMDLNDVTLEQARAFLEAVESDNNYVAVTTLNVSRKFGVKEKLNLKLEISAYGKPSAAPKAGEAAGSAAGSAEGSAAPAGGS